MEEIIAAVNVALGIDSPARCRAADTDGNRLVSIDEILQAVIAVLEGCPAVRPSPTRTLVPATATPSPFEESVCGGAVASIPRLCALDVRPVYTIGSTVYGVLRVCLSDLEGDLEGFCLGLSMNGEPPEVLCDFFDPPFPAGQTLCHVGHRFERSRPHGTNQQYGGDHIFLLPLRPLTSTPITASVNAETFGSLQR